MAAWASNHRCARPVETLCKHADEAVRTLGIQLWKRPFPDRRQPFCLRISRPPSVDEKKSSAGKPVHNGGKLSTPEFAAERDTSARGPARRRHRGTPGRTGRRADSAGGRTGGYVHQPAHLPTRLVWLHRVCDL